MEIHALYETGKSSSYVYCLSSAKIVFVVSVYQETHLNTPVTEEDGGGGASLYTELTGHGPANTITVSWDQSLWKRSGWREEFPRDCAGTVIFTFRKQDTAKHGKY